MTFAESGITRSDIIIALGARSSRRYYRFAAFHLRGVEFVQIPTTLLAQVDSQWEEDRNRYSSGKNLVGLCASAVICDSDTLKTLPSETLSRGHKVRMIRIRAFELIESHDLDS